MIDDTNSANTNYYIITLEEKTYNGTTLATEIKNKTINTCGQYVCLNAICDINA